MSPVHCGPRGSNVDVLLETIGCEARSRNARRVSAAENHCVAPLRSAAREEVDEGYRTASTIGTNP